MSYKFVTSHSKGLGISFAASILTFTLRHIYNMRAKSSIQTAEIRRFLTR